MEIKGAGDKVYIRTFGNITVDDYAGSIEYTDLVSPTIPLLIDQAKYFAFKVDDISKAQANIDIMAGYLERAKIAIDLAKDTTLLAHVADADAGNVIPTALMTKNTAYTQFTQLAKTLKKANVKPAMKPWAVINPDIEAVLVNSPEFLLAGRNIGVDTLTEGAIGKIAGLEIFSCTNFVDVAGTFNILAGCKDAMTFASQVVEIEDIRLPESFDTAIRGLYVFGPKVVLKKGIAVLTVTL